MTDAERSVTFDVFKGVAIIGVVAAHTVACVSTPYSGGPATPATLISNLFFSALMIFFVISGYLYNPEKGFGKSVKKRILQLGVGIVILQIVLPIIVAGIGMAAANPNIEYDYFWKSTIGMILGPFFVESIGWFPADYINELYVCTRIYYFIQMMLVGFVVYYAIAGKCDKNPKLTVAAIIACIAVECVFSYFDLRLPLYAESAPIAVAFMLVGNLLKNMNFLRIMDDENKKPAYWIVALALVGIAAVIFWFSPIKMHFIAFSFGNDGWISVIPFFIGTLCSGMGIFMLTVAFRYVSCLENIFVFLGRRTLCIYLLHNFFVRAGLAIYSSPADSIFVPNNIQSLPEAIFYFVFALLASLAVSLAVERVNPKKRKKTL